MYKKIIFAIGLITTFFLLLNFIFSLILDKEDQTFTLDHRFNRIIVSKEEVKDKMVVDDSGFRNLNYRQKFINFKKNDFFNIIFLGGSTVFGALVKDNETIPVYFEQILINKSDYPKLNVINLGQASYNFRENILILQNLLIDGYKPDLVIIYNGINEIWNLKDLIREGKENEIKYDQTGNKYIKYLIDNQNNYINFHNLPIIKFLKKTFLHIDGFVTNNIYDYKKKITPLSVNFIDNFSIHVSDIYTNTYKTLSYLSSNYDFHIIVFLQPTRGHYSLKKNCWIKRNNGTSTFYFTEVKNEQKNLERLDLFYKILYEKIMKKTNNYKNKNINIFNISNVFSNHNCLNDPIFSDSIGHLNSLGNRLIAEEIFNTKYLQEKLVLE